MKYILLCTLALTQIFAAPALDRMREYTSSDGTTFMAKGQGNHNLNWIKTQDGEILKYNSESKNYEYAQIKENKLRASGVKYEKDNSTRARSIGHINKLDTEELHKLWTQKQVEHHKKKSSK